MARQTASNCSDLCIGCHSCSVACKTENEVPPAVFRSWVKLMDKGVYPNARSLSLPVLCNNCENAVCVKVCPVKASYKRDDGIVMVDPHKCVGCKYCMAACPYQVRHLNPIRRYVQKCSFCYQRVDRGLELGLKPGVDPDATPACVVICPVGARIFGDLNDPQSNVSQLLANSPSFRLREDLGTSPRVYYLPAREEAS